MTQGFYRRLAWTGIQKNRRLYLPYLLTCAGMVMMTYIVSFLSSSELLLGMPGGSDMRLCLGLGFFVIVFFSVIFLFYTHSFLIRRRKKEFGLYNILGMGKRHLAIVLLWESLLCGGISIVGGLLAGVLFSKLAEMCIFYLLGGTAGFSLQLSPDSLVQTALMFLAIFALILLDSLRQLHLTNPIELLRSESAGERPPRANWFLALAGVILLGVAYWLAVTIQDPVAALTMFFVAVLLVIAATYLLFVSGSVAFCRVLQKNKRYYYRTNHFVSVSSMVFRMKRNGAGLASICILCTMVLVMISTTVCLYIGAEDSLRSRYPRSINLTAHVDSRTGFDGDWQEQVRELARQTVSEAKEEPQNILDYRAMLFAGFVRDGRIRLDLSAIQSVQESVMDVWQVFVIPIEDYNRLMGENVTLEPDEVLLYSTKESFVTDGTIAFEDGTPYTVRSVVSDFVDNSIDSMQIVPSLYVFVSDLEPVAQALSGADGGEWTEYSWTYAFDLSCSDEEQRAIQSALEQSLNEINSEREGSLWIVCDGLAEERASFFAFYGSLLFLGILLGVVFIFAAVLIIYYKQISEGYEDQSRFDIMQKVGMTKREIRKSINSQVLTVFFLPLILAGVHLAFAFPMLQKLLMLLGLVNVSLLIFVTVLCYLVFAVFYLAIYRVTSRAYYGIVSGAREEL